MNSRGRYSPGIGGENTSPNPTYQQRNQSSDLEYIEQQLQRRPQFRRYIPKCQRKFTPSSINQKKMTPSSESEEEEVKLLEPIFKAFSLSTMMDDVASESDWDPVASEKLKMRSTVVSKEIEDTSKIPKLRRKRNPWSAAEEQALQEGVNIFSCSDKQIPWKMILNFGADVFVNRTAIDLKDKWRNMSKRSPKV